MKKVLFLAAKELRISFVTPLAYVVMAGFVLLCGFFFFTLLQDYNTQLSVSAMQRDICPSLNKLVVEQFYDVLAIVLIFIIPILTMRVIAEEKQQGTFELLVTSPITPSQIVLGKFLGVCGVVGMMLLLSFAFPLVLIVFTDPELPPIVVGFVGLLLYAASFVALGIAISAFTKSQTIAGIVSLIVLLVFFVIDAPAPKFEGMAADVLTYLDPNTHLDLFFRGVLTGSGVVYFLSVILFGLFVANRVLEAQDWR